MLSPIKTNVARKLRNREYRHTFFQIWAEDEIASELRRFRQRRRLKQSALALLCDTKQSAISRIEQASYAKWRFDTLLKIANALDLRVRVKLEDMADVIKQYEQLEAMEQTLPEFAVLTTNANPYHTNRATDFWNSYGCTIGDLGNVSTEEITQYV